MAEDWPAYERAWAQDPLHLPRRVSLPALIAAADSAVAAAVAGLTREYGTLLRDSAATEMHPSEPCPPPPPPVGASASAPARGSEEDATGGAPCIVDAAPHARGDALDWWRLYNALCFIQAPMVRCSRPAFRQVCREWGTRISYTHMLIAESFVKSAHARHAEFARYAGEDHLIVQLAAKSGPAAAQAALLVRPYCDAVDLNCGCPQRWAMKEGIGAALLEKPELVADMVRCIRNAAPDGVTPIRNGGNHTGSCGSRSAALGGLDGAAAAADNAPPPYLPCVVKMRVKDDVRRSVDFVRQCEAAGASWVTVHGRTPACAPSAAVRFEDVKLLREHLSIPVVLNGGISDVSTAMEAALRTGCGGLMSANGLLDNPALFYCAPSRAAMEAELSFATPTSVWGVPEDGSGAADAYSPVQPVSFLWAPDRARRGAALLRYTVPDMWQASVTPREAISDFVRAAIRTDLMVPTTVQQVLRMARLYVSPAKRNHLAHLRSNLSVLRALQEIGVYVKEGHIQCE